MTDNDILIKFISDIDNIHKLLSISLMSIEITDKHIYH